MFCGRTLPICHRLSSRTRCLAATCAVASRCCIEQPPHTPKCTHAGLTRILDSRCSTVILAASHFGFLRYELKPTRSPGRAPSTNTTLPALASSFGRWPMPRPSMSSDSMSRMRSCIKLKNDEFQRGNDRNVRLKEKEPRHGRQGERTHIRIVAPARQASNASFWMEDIWLDRPAFLAGGFRNAA